MLVFSFLAMLMLMPLLLLVACAIKLTSPGPVFFVQERYGYRRRKMRFIKFRTMVREAETLLHSLEHLNEASGPIFKIRNDPRITPLGRILRKTSIDELPQLWNVFIGDMSLVGPRPMSLRDVSLFSEAHLLRRFRVKPGITGSMADFRAQQSDIRPMDRTGLLLHRPLVFRSRHANFVSYHSRDCSRLRGNVERFDWRRYMVRVAVVHDYFTQHGGAENVAGELYNLVPQADMFTTVALDKYVPACIPTGKAADIVDAKFAADRRPLRLYFPLYPFGVQSLDLSGYDLVISSSSGYGKGVRTRSDALHVCYCHTPMRWIWRYHDYVSREKLAVSKRLLLPLALKGLKVWDIDAARQPDQYVANSTVVAQRIRECYGREAIVIPPPIDASRFVLQPRQDDYYLVLARFVSYKRIDLAVSACNAFG